MMPKFAKYAIGAACAAAAFFFAPQVLPAAVMSMTGSQWLLGAVAGFVGLGPVSNFIESSFFSKKAGTPPSSPSHSNSTSNDTSDEAHDADLVARAAKVSHSNEEPRHESPYNTRSKKPVLIASRDSSEKVDVQLEEDDAPEVEAAVEMDLQASDDAKPVATANDIKTRKRRRRKAK